MWLRVSILSLVSMSCSDVANSEALDVFPDPSVAALASAACSGDAVTMQQLISRGVSPNEVGERNITPLLWALRCKNKDGVLFLLKNGSDPNQPSDMNVTPLSVAATISDLEFTEILLDSGAEINGIQADVETSPLLRSFSHAMESNYWETYNLLLERGADINRPYGRNGTTIANRVAASGRYDILLDLLDRGYNYNLERIEAATEMYEASPDQVENRNLALERLHLLLENRELQ